MKDFLSKDTFNMDSGTLVVKAKPSLMESFLFYFFSHKGYARSAVEN